MCNVRNGLEWSNIAFEYNNKVSGLVYGLYFVKG